MYPVLRRCSAMIFLVILALPLGFGSASAQNGIRSELYSSLANVGDYNTGVQLLVRYANGTLNAAEAEDWELDLFQRVQVFGDAEGITSAEMLVALADVVSGTSVAAMIAIEAREPPISGLPEATVTVPSTRRELM